MAGEFIDFECASCESQTQVQYGDEQTDENGNLICDDCAGPDTFDDLEDFPKWVEYESYNDNYELERNFARQHDIEQDSIPDRHMKYCTFCVWFKVDSDATVSGPYANKGDADTI